MAQFLVHRLKALIKDGVITPPAATIIYGGNGSGTVSFEYNGDGTISVSSNNTGVATVSLSGRTITINYIAAGNATITISAPKTHRFKACSATFSVTCAKTKLTKPSLSTTSYTQTAPATFTPGYNNYDSNLMTVGGTTSASAPGSYSITFYLKDSNRYCWSDGSIGAVTCGWNVAGGSVTFYVKPSVYSSPYTMTFTKTYQPWSQMNTDIYQHRWSTGEYENYEWYIHWKDNYASWYTNGSGLERRYDLGLWGDGPTNGTTYNMGKCIYSEEG